MKTIYFDSFAGLIQVKVLATSDTEVKFKIKRARRGYKIGDVETTIPRNLVYKTRQSCGNQYCIAVPVNELTARIGK